MKDLYCKCRVSEKGSSSISESAIKEYIADKDRMNKNPPINNTQDPKNNNYSELQGSEYWVG